MATLCFRGCQFSLWTLPIRPFNALQRKTASVVLSGNVNSHTNSTRYVNSRKHSLKVRADQAQTNVVVEDDEQQDVIGAGKEGVAAASNTESREIVDTKVTEEVINSVKLLKNAAKTKKVPSSEVVYALEVLKKAKLDPSNFFNILGGKESPGRTWMLIFTVQARSGKGFYFPVTAVQRFDASDPRQYFADTDIINTATIQFIVALAASQGWTLHQMDVKTVFLHGFLKEEVCVEQPQGFEVHDRKTHVCRLKKAIHRLKQAPRAWYARIDNFLMKLGFTRSNVNPNLYYKTTQGFWGSHVTLMKQRVPIWSHMSQTICQSAKVGSKSAELFQQDQAMRIENGIYLGPIGYLTFEGRLTWKKRILAFIFEYMNLKIGPLGPLKINLAKEKDKGRTPTTKDPFFIWFYIDEEIAVAQGRGGGTAFWCRCTRVT